MSESAALKRYVLTRMASAAVVLLAPVAANAAISEVAAKALVEQARFWMNKGRPDLAAESWKKLLAADPNNVDALAALAKQEIDNDRLDAGKNLTERLKKISPSSTATRRVESALSFKTLDPQLLGEAREAARLNQVDKAIGIYRRVFAGKPPPRDMAIEYYSLMGGSDENWEEGRQGLARLYQEDPSDRAVALAYARHLTYRVPTRREGVKMLADLTKQKPSDSDASDAWKQSLTWLEPTKADIPLLQSYLSTRGNDAVIRGRIASINAMYAKPVASNRAATSYQNFKLDPKTQTLMAGFSAINAGNLDEAAAKFEKLLSENPNNGDALGGLGVIRQKQDQLDEAVKLLDRAHQLSGRTKWGDALRSARFWQVARLATAAHEAGNQEEALAYFQQAQRIDPSQLVVVQGLSDIAAQQGRLAEAERGYREMLRRDPASLPATRGLISVLAQQDRTDEASAMIDRLTEEQREEMGGFGSIKSEQLRKQASGFAARGESARAIQLLEDALLWDPLNPWLRLELARSYQSVGATREARAVVDGLLLSNPDMPTALYTSALMSAETQDWIQGLNRLEQIPLATRTKEMANLQQRLWVRAQMDRVAKLHQARQLDAATRVMAQVESSIGRGDAELLAALAQGYVTIGDNGRALALMRNALSLTSKPETGQLIQYAGILLSTGQDAELAAQLRSLYAVPLTEEQRKGLDLIRVGYALRQFDSLRNSNQLAAAYNVLIPLYNERPDDLSVQFALGRLYSSAGEHKEALAWYDHALRRDPANLGGLVAAAGSALAVSNLSYAESALNNARQLAPDDVDVLSGLGRLYRAQGKSQLAAEFLQRALLAEQRLEQTRLAAASRAMPARAYGQASPHAVNDGAWRPLPVTSAYGSNSYGASRTTPAAPPALLPQTPRITVRPGDQVSSVTRQANATPPSVASSYTSLQNPVAPMVTQAAIVPVQYTYPTLNSPAPQREAGRFNLSSATVVPSTVPAAVPSNASGLLLIPSPTAPRTQAPLVTAQPVPSLTPVMGAAMVENKQIASLREEVADLRESSSGSIAAGIHTRQRNGTPGLSQLSEVSMPIEIRVPAGNIGQLVGRISPVLLHSGKLTQTNLGTSQGFGTNALDSVSTLTNNNANQTARGLALGLGYETLNLKLDVGTTPLGFRVVNLIGGIAYSNRLTDTSGLRLELSRRPVMDSLLSYAGTVDDRTGLTWGGVTATGGRGELSMQDGNFGAYGYAGMHFVGGRNVANNLRGEGGLGAYYKPIQTPDHDVSVGIGLTALGYQRNLRYFTFGHGGYFSPQRYLALNFPVEWAGRVGALSFKLDASIGVQSFRERAADYYPTSAALQGYWAGVAGSTNAASGTNVWQAYYPGMQRTGLGYRFGGVAEYRIAPSWAIGGKLAFDNASNYSSSSGLIYMRYSFEPMTRLVTFPPSPLRPFP